MALTSSNVTHAGGIQLLFLIVYLYSNGVWLCMVLGTYVIKTHVQKRLAHIIKFY